MAVLLTRAPEDAARTRQRLETMGHRVVIAPMVAFERLATAWPAGSVDALVATSSRAFRSEPCLWGPTSEARRLLPLWLVGQRTKDAARHAGYLGAARVAGNAVTLVPQISARPRSRFAYLAGRDRKADIERAFAGHDATLEVIEVYRSTAVERLSPTTIELLASGQIRHVVHYSRRSAELFALQIENCPEIRLDALGTTHLCISKDASEPLSTRGCTVAVASAANEDAILALLPAAT